MKSRQSGAATPTTTLRAQRKLEGVCPRCGAQLEQRAETNALTGAQLKRDGVLVFITECSENCGFSIRPYANRRRKQ